MKIDASQVSYWSAHRSASATETIDETFTRGRTADRAAATASTALPQAEPMDTVQLTGAKGSSTTSDYDELKDLDPKQRLAVLVLESLLGHRIKLMHLSSSATSALAGAPPAAGGGQVHRKIELHTETEQTSFRAQGAVETADGRRIQFSAELNMQRDFKSGSVTVDSAPTTDPLVVNFGGEPARIAGAKVAFDLNSDGTAESVSFVASGSGFLALDSNGDGKVTDGKELFGPRTGNGFAELASYDADGNGWIDENDPVFGQLRIWTSDGLSTLAENGVGAIATTSADTPFAIKDTANVLQANVRATGIYLSESGAAGTIQQVDLAEA
jgi:hypothetical protein